MPSQEIITNVSYDVIEQRGPDPADPENGIVTGRVLVFVDPSAGKVWQFPLDLFSAADISGRLDGKPPRKRVEVPAPGMSPHMLTHNGHGT